MKPSVAIGCSTLAIVLCGCDRSKTPASSATKPQNAQASAASANVSKQQAEVLVLLYDAWEGGQNAYGLASQADATESNLDGFWLRAKYVPVSREQLSTLRANAASDKAEVLQQYSVLKQVGRFELLIARNFKPLESAKSTDTPMFAGVEMLAGQLPQAAPNQKVPSELHSYCYARLPGQSKGTAGLLMPVSLRGGWDGREPVFVRSFQDLKALISGDGLEVSPLDVGRSIPQGIGYGLEDWPAPLAAEFNQWLQSR